MCTQTCRKLMCTQPCKNICTQPRQKLTCTDVNYGISGDMWVTKQGRSPMVKPEGRVCRGNVSCQIVLWLDGFRYTVQN
jgi:hypothetical protein